MTAQPSEPSNLPAVRPQAAAARVPQFRWSDLTRAQRNELAYEYARKLSELEFQRATAAVRMEAAAVLSGQAVDGSIQLGNRIRDGILANDNPLIHAALADQMYAFVEASKRIIGTV